MQENQLSQNLFYLQTKPLLTMTEHFFNASLLQKQENILDEIKNKLRLVHFSMRMVAGLELIGICQRISISR